jgi:3D (Asp-Asp-Asp) domain-containing protein
MILGINGIIASSISGATPLLLDLYPNAAAAYSVRKLRTAYTGNAIRVRRSSDNTEQDIGFVSGNLDTTALTSFCSGTNGFVTTWYDQSGNGRNATQTTAANQPQIVSSGSVLTLTGVGSAMPILRFDGINDEFAFSSITASVFTTFYPQKKNANADLSAWFSQNVSSSTPYSPIIFGTVGTFIGVNSKADYSTSYNNSNYILMSGYRNAALNGFIQINNTAISIPSTFAETGNNIFNRLNSRFSTQYSKCDVPEMIFYDSDNSSNVSAINTNINTYYAIY